MNARITIGFVAALTLSGCMPPNASAPTPRPLKPAEGPRASIYVDYFGGLYTRQIHTRFRVDKPSYVVVGHLGGDGEIRILYPETPGASGWVAGGKTITLKPRSAMYDMSPHLFTFATAPYRNSLARYDSYDGLGNGYVFIIASRRPIDHRALAVGKEYESVTVEDYERTSDLRYAVRAFADEIVTGPYTLRYASNPQRSLFAEMTGCSTHLGLSAFMASPFYSYSLFTYPGAFFFDGFGFANYFGHNRMCRGSSYAQAYGGYFTGTVYVPPPTTTTTPLTPQLQRPQRRTLQEAQHQPVLTVGRSAIDRAMTPSERRTRERESVAWRPSEQRPGTPGRGSEFRGRDRWSSGSGTSGSSEIYRPTRPIDRPRLNAPAPPPQPPATTTSTTSGNGTKAERPRRP